MEHQQKKCQESTAPFQVYFQTPREGITKVCKVILNITYIYNPVGHLDMLWACSNGPDLHQDTLVEFLEPCYLRYLVSSHHWFQEQNSCIEMLFCSNLEKTLFFLNFLFFLFEIFFSQEYAAKILQLTKNSLESQLTKKVSNFAAWPVYCENHTLAITALVAV